jgi:glycosyltransferase involved in cell wall biosynthesis
MKDFISIIIRTKNEERWITQCLNAVFNQTLNNFEVIIVDDKSTDKTVEKANQFSIKSIISYKDNRYLPGKALNIGIEEAEGDFVVCLSGHCVPHGARWLENLWKNFKEADVMGVYGRQEPMPFTPDADKRDLAIAFGLDRKVQEKDPFFHNANSMILRSVWEEIPFDEKVTNIEDRVWAKQILEKGYKIIYEPGAIVHHYHGIHQDGDEQRCRNVVRILENLYSDYQYKSIELDRLNVVAIIPVKGEIQYLAGKPLLAYTIQRALESRYVKKCVVSTDNPALANMAKNFGAEVPFIRDASFSKGHIDLDQALQHSLNKIEEFKIFPDLIIPLEITFPFRPKGLIDNMIVQLAQKGLDSVIAAKSENRAIWKEQESGIIQLNEGLTPRQFKDPTFVELRGVASVTHPEFLRKGHLFGNRIGIYELNDPYAHLEVRNKEEFEMASLLINTRFK